MTPKFQDKADWIAAFREGKAGAFEQVFKEQHRQLCYAAVKLGLDLAEAEDVVADSFTKLWHGREQFTNEEHIKGFLYTATRNACFNLLKQKQRRMVSNNELSYLQAAEEDDFSRKMIEAELLQKLYPYIEDLPRMCKAVFKQLYFEGATTEEAAAKLGISSRNVLNQKARALQLLRGKILLFLILAGCLYGAGHYQYNRDSHSLPVAPKTADPLKKHRNLFVKRPYWLFIYCTSTC